MCGGERVPYADDDEAMNAGGVGARQGGLRAFRQVLGIEVAVCVDEHRVRVPWLLVDEEAFDERGWYRGAWDHPGPGFLVFAQKPDASMVEADWDRQGARFMATRVGFTVPKTHLLPAPDGSDAALVVVAPDVAPPGKRWVLSRPVADGDRHRIGVAEATGGLGGMSQLAARANRVFVVASDDDDDALALAVGAILSSLYLGPIVLPSDRQTFGVQTARRKLESGSRPYR